MSEAVQSTSRLRKSWLGSIAGRVSASLVNGSRPPLMALGIYALVVICALFGELIAPFAKDQAHFANVLQPPAWSSGGGWPFLLGTDHLGRDMLSRLIAGTRISLVTAGAAIFVAGVLGALPGSVAG